MKLCDKITKLRKRKGYTQEDLASIMEVSRQSVFKWESGENTPDLEKIRKLTKVFNVSFDELLDDDKELGEVSEVEPRPQKAKNRVLTIIISIVIAVAIGIACFFIGRATKKSVSNPDTETNTSRSFDSEMQQSSSELTSEELTKSLTVDDLVDRWQTARYVWTITSVSGNVMLTSIYDKVDMTTDAPNIDGDYLDTSIFTGYNETTGLMEGKIFHYTGTSTKDWYSITMKRDKDGVYIYYKNLTFVKF